MGEVRKGSQGYGSLMTLLKDYAVEIKVRNNWLLQRMRARGLSVPQLADKARTYPGMIYNLLNLKTTPIHQHGEFRQIVVRISEVLGCLPAHLFPPQHLETPLWRNKIEVEASIEDLALLAPEAVAGRVALPSDDIEKRQADEALKAILQSLTPRQERIIRCRFGIDCEAMTFEQIAEKFGVTRERIRQIELKAMRSLRAKKPLREIFSTLTGQELPTRSQELPTRSRQARFAEVERRKREESERLAELHSPEARHDSYMASQAWLVLIQQQGEWDFEEEQRIFERRAEEAYREAQRRAYQIRDHQTREKILDQIADKMERQTIRQRIQMGDEAWFARHKTEV